MCVSDSVVAAAGSLFSRGCGDGSICQFKELVLVGEFLASSERDMAGPRAKRPAVHSGRERLVDRVSDGRSVILCSPALRKARSHY